MKSKEFIKSLKSIVRDNKTLYVLGCFGAPMNAKNKIRYSQNNTFNSNRSKMINSSTEDTFGFDCIGLIKGILWGWNADKTMTYGGAKYVSNGVPDTGADGCILRYCTEVSTKFDNIIPGEAVWLTGHIGVYIGNGKVVECSPKFENCVQITTLKNIANGDNERTWTKHGKLIWIDYSDYEDEKDLIEEEKVTTYKVKKGDTLTKISKEFNTTVDELITNNKESHPKISKNYICTGWVLNV